MNLQKKAAELVDKRNLENNYSNIQIIGGMNPNKGVTRLAYSSEENQAHEYLRRQMEHIGLDITIDGQTGNLIGIFKGEDERLILSGSHLDTVKTGGNADGVTGCIAALEALRCITELKTTLPYSIGCCAFRGEESDRFGQSLIGSKGMFGELCNRELSSKDDSGKPLLNAMLEHGLNPLYKNQTDPMIRYFIELHPEQSYILEQEKKQIGIIEKIAAPERWKVEITGRRDHSGATPMTGRKDANQGMAEMMCMIEEIAKKNYPPTVMTVGKCRDIGGSINTISGQAYFTIDCRDIDKEKRKKIIEQTLLRIDQIAEKRHLSVDYHQISESDPVTLNQEVAKSIEKSCQNLDINYMRMNSGASHDAATFANHRIPTGMIFIPSIDGISHAPEESINIEDLVTGTKVLTTTILDLALEK